MSVHNNNWLLAERFIVILLSNQLNQPGQFDLGGVELVVDLPVITE
ncbi:hypothetical protein KUL10_11440 [Glaciecola sp. KUL10]|nr:hypothetical protein KUL10_11440 [Glaciecola sp. KUL10]